MALRSATGQLAPLHCDPSGTPRRVPKPQAALLHNATLENVGQSSPFIRKPDEPLSKTKG
jgi:hypothetical protein